MGLLLFFFDGVGVGRDDPEANPFRTVEARRLAPLYGGPAEPDCGFRALDAALGVPGLPQSATGQTTLLTGVNAAQALGRHQTGLPGPTLRPILERESIFLKLTRLGKRATFANAYTREHLEAPRPRWSATTRAVQAAALPFRMWDEEGRRGESLSHDFTGEVLRSRGFDAPALSAEEAAEVLHRLVESHDFVLYEYFLTDYMAHRGTTEQRREQAARVESLVDAVLRRIDLSRNTVAVVSDHGNLEETTDNRHTANPIPFLVWGAGRRALIDSVQELTDVTPAVVRLLGG